MLEIYQKSKEHIIKHNEAHLVLITKILLGVFGFVPAFDRYFCSAFRDISKNQMGFRAVNKTSLKFIQDFYQANQQEIDELQQGLFVKDFKGSPTTLNYPKAKIIDMYGFQYGLNMPHKP
ncbi:hypothetical protein [Moraxella caviae]|uniref:hypothetical protein n=1 Tax=Moraxella caviae TaxID=34060 RepID=UPI0009936B17|nr:hypothetical protein [Moraxella caviae]